MLQKIDRAIWWVAAWVSIGVVTHLISNPATPRWVFHLIAVGAGRSIYQATVGRW